MNDNVIDFARRKRRSGPTPNVAAAQSPRDVPVADAIAADIAASRIEIGLPHGAGVTVVMLRPHADEPIAKITVRGMPPSFVASRRRPDAVASLRFDNEWSMNTTCAGLLARMRGIAESRHHVRAIVVVSDDEHNEDQS